MNELNYNQSQEDFGLECLENEDELERILEEMSSYIGWIVIHFNSLENSIAFCVTEMITHDAYQDERVDVFLSEMQYSGKTRALVNLYGQVITTLGLTISKKNLIELEKTFIECGKRRNEYAHADWVGMKKENYVCVKTNAKKNGIVRRYRKYNIDKIKEDIEYICKAEEILELYHEELNDEIHGRI